MVVKAVNGKQGFVNLETQDIPESKDSLYLNPDERQEIIKLGIQTRELREHTFDKVIHTSKEISDHISLNSSHRLDLGMHFDGNLKRRLKDHLANPHEAGRRGPKGERGFPGPPGGSGGGGGAASHTDLVDMPSAIVSDHDGRYYTKMEIGSTGATPGASLVGVPILAGATHSTLQEFLNTRSAGIVSGGELTAGTAVVNVAAGTGMVKVTDSPTGEIHFFDWDAVNNVALTDNALNYVYVNYNVGTEAVTVAATTDFEGLNLHTQIPIGIAYRAGDEVEAIDDGVEITGHEGSQWHRLAHRGIERMSGAEVAESGERYLTVTAGSYYKITTHINTDAVDTTGAGRFMPVYRDGGGGWTFGAEAQQFSNILYDDGDGTPGNVGVAKYATYYVYQCLEGDIYIQYGQGNSNTLTIAQNEAVPTPPNYLLKWASLRAKIIILNGATNAISVSNYAAVGLTSFFAGVHNELSGLQGGTADEYYHLTAAKHGYIDQDVTSGSNPTFGNLSVTDIDAHTISGKLTAGVTEIEGSNFDINGGAIDATVIGGTTPAAIDGTTIDATGAISSVTTGATPAELIADASGTSPKQQARFDINAEATGTAVMRFKKAGSVEMVFFYNAATDVLEFRSGATPILTLDKAAADATFNRGVTFREPVIFEDTADFDELATFDAVTIGGTLTVTGFATHSNILKMTDNNYSSWGTGSDARMSYISATPALQLIDIVGSSMDFLIRDFSTVQVGGNASYTNISNGGDMSFVGGAGFYPRLVRQDAEPANGVGATQIDDEEMIYWIDTNDSNRVYLMFNDQTNTQIVKVELT